jgi:hypothetical protein
MPTYSSRTERFLSRFFLTFWEMFGKCLGNVWEMFGTFLSCKSISYVFFWEMFGKCLGNVWEMFGKCLGILNAF